MPRSVVGVSMATVTQFPVPVFATVVGKVPLVNRVIEFSHNSRLIRSNSIRFKFKTNS